MLGILLTFCQYVRTFSSIDLGGVILPWHDCSWTNTKIRPWKYVAAEVNKIKRPGQAEKR